MLDGKLRVLIVEDQESSRDALASLLEDQGFAVIVAADGEQAVVEARTSRPDVIVMDLDLPRINGWEATLRIRRDAATANIPVLALTGHTRAEAELIGREVGCSEVMTKPFDLERLIASLRRLCAAAPGPGEAVPPPENC